MSRGTLDVADLNPLARTLAESAISLEHAATDTPAIPDAGASTGAVAASIAQLCQAMSTVTEATAQAADLVQANDKQFKSAEHANAAGIHAAGGHL